MEKLSKNLFVVILCGGGGTRLWPLSRNKSPKQFIQLLGKKTLYERTLERTAGLVDPANIIIITNKEYLEIISELSPEIPPSQIIVEPEKKNTALAMGVAAAFIHKKNPNAVIINLASDHLIRDNEMFHKTMLAAATSALEHNSIVTVGINPTFPHTGLGYIEIDGKIGKMNDLDIYRVEGFTEKPELEVAIKYLASGDYYWNANLYTWSTKTILKEFQIHAPIIYSHIDKIMAALGTKEEKLVIKNQYALCPEEQIDTAISEKSKNLIVIPGNFGWTDIGSWNIVHDEAEKDDDSNSFIQRKSGSNWLKIDTKSTLLNTNKKITATIGIKNLMIIETEDALLIAKKDRSQDVKKIVENLKESSDSDLL